MLAVGSYHSSPVEALAAYAQVSTKEREEEPAVSSLLSQLRTYAEREDGRKIPLIKACREFSGMGLKEAKEFIEQHFEFRSDSHVIRTWL